MKLVIFDFCDTICKIQSANYFVDFCLKKLCMKGVYFKLLAFFSSNLLILRVLAIFFPSFNFSKRLKLFALRGIDQYELLIIAKQFHEFLIGFLNNEVVKILERHVNEGDHVIIVSGGYFEYLQYFKNYFKIYEVLATKISFNNGKCNGYFEGQDCMFDEKINMINNYIEKSKLEYSSSICYTDSITDLGLLKWVDHPIVVSNLISQKWPLEYGFIEIVINAK